MNLQDWIEWFTDERLERLNALRIRGGASPLTKADAELLMTRISKSDQEAIRARISG